LAQLGYLLDGKIHPEPERGSYAINSHGSRS